MVQNEAFGQKDATWSNACWHGDI